MTAKQYLRQYEYADRRVKRLSEEYQAEMELIDSVRSTADLDGMPRGNGISKPVEDRAIKLADKAAALKIAELDALHIRQEVFETIQRIKCDGKEADVLYFRYIKLMRWEEIADELIYTLPGIYSVHGRALRMVEEVLNESH